MIKSGERAPSSALHADAGFRTVRPRLGFIDLMLHLWRAKGLMILVATPIIAVGVLVALSFSKNYESSSRLYVRAGDEIRMAPGIHDASRESPLQIEQIVQGELELLRSPVVAERTLNKFDLEQLYPNLTDQAFKKASQAPEMQHEAIRFELRQTALEAFTKNFGSSAAPRTPVINISFRHKNRLIAAEVLDATMASYLEYRTELFGARPVSQLTNQRKRLEGELADAEQAINAFLDENDISDFDNERSTAQSLFSEVSSAMFAVDSRISAVEGQLASTRTQLDSTPEELDIFVEDTSAQALRDLEIQRNQALVSFREDSLRVQAIDKQISELKAFIDAQSDLSGTIRRGPNPTYQALETRFNDLEAEAESLSEQKMVLRRQLTNVDKQLKTFMLLQAQWNELNRNRTFLENNVRIIAEREQQEVTIAGLAAESADSVAILEPATVPLRGSSPRFAIAFASVMLAGFSALGVGLLRMLTREGFATASALQRTIGLPVLGVVGRV